MNENTTEQIIEITDDNTISESPKKLSKKTIIIISAIAAAIVLLIVIISANQSFEKVKDKSLDIVGSLRSGDGYFTIETHPDFYDNLDSYTRNAMLSRHKDAALEAIQYANDKLGFPGVYSQMMNTSAIMGRQYAENNKYEVTWSYSPSYGLTVTYRKK